MFGKGLLSSRALTLLGSGWATGAFILLDSRSVADGTLSGSYKNSPAMLLKLNERDAKKWLDRYPGIRNSMMALYDLVKASDEENQVSYAGESCSIPEFETDSSSDLMSCQS